MSESILEASKRAKKGGLLGFLGRKSVIAAIIILVIVGAFYFLKPEEKKSQASDNQIKQTAVKKGDIKIAIGAEGKVVAEDGVDLSFAVSGDTLEVVDTFVGIGDYVKKGDKIAKVKSDSLELNVQSAWANYQSALASYNERIAGATDDETTKAKNSIKNAELNLEQAELNLERTKISADDSIKLAQDKVDDTKKDLDYDFESNYEEAIDEKYEDLVMSLKSLVISLETVLKDSDEIVGIDEEYLNDSFENVLGVKEANSLFDAAGSYKKARDSYLMLNDRVVSLNNSSDHLQIDEISQEAKNTLNLFEDHLYKMHILLVATITSKDLSQSALASYKSTISSNRSSINSKISSLDSDIKAVRDAKENLADYRQDYDDDLSDYQKAYDDALVDLEDVKLEAQRDIKDAERTIESRKISLEEAKLNYEDLLEPLTDTELASAKSQLTSASVSLKRAQDELANTTLISPIDGEVAALNYKTGDTIMKDDGKSVVSIINNDTLFIETDIEEADISRLELGQRAIATFDALDDIEMEGEISFISLTSDSGNNGIVTYQVRVLFEKQEDSKVREGMTADVEFVIGGVDDVLNVPVDAVRNVEGKASVQLAGGEWREVVTGFTDGDDVEIISGLNEGDRVVY